MRCLAQLSTMKLAAFDSSTGALARRIMALLRECNSQRATLEDCLKLLNNLLKRHAAFTPTDAQFRFIITFAFGDLEGDHREEQRSTTFSLMRAVLARRPLLPEVYDCMKTVSSLVVRANAKDVRELCAQALVQFLLDYPLGERRLQQHLEALAANLEYQHASGRLSAMNCLRDVRLEISAEAVSRCRPRSCSSPWSRGWARTRTPTAGAPRARRSRRCSSASPARARVVSSSPSPSAGARGLFDGFVHRLLRDG